MNRGLSTYARDYYYSRNRAHGQRVADGLAPVATRGDLQSHAADPETSPSPDGSGSAPSLTEQRLMDDAEWDAAVEHRTRLFTDRYDGD